MIPEFDDKEQIYSVTCVWCGSKIREDKHKDEQGVCLRCFYKILGDHLLAQRRTRVGDFVSER
jgi:DNA-directed RNA polymerase subunit RPC12/RpoP